MSQITVLKARKILTMDRNRPEATHVAVAGGRVLAVGWADCADAWGECVHDDRYADKVMMPGLIEAHAHVMAGGLWRFAYCGHYARTDPEGANWPGITSCRDVIERLNNVAAKTKPGQPVVGWGLDPHHLSDGPLTRHALDQVSEEHPVAVLHSSVHVLSANTAALMGSGLYHTPQAGVVQGDDGHPTGELQEFAAMGPVMALTGLDFSKLADADAVRSYGKVARNVGVTTAADLLSALEPDEVDMLEKVTGDARFPIRYVPVMNAMRGAPEAEAERAVALRARSTDKLHLGRAKLFTDGSIQAYTALLQPPGYFSGPDHGMLNMEEEHFRAAVAALHKAGVKTHIHTNGDAASELAIDAIEQAMLGTGNADHRHTLEHVQLAGRAQFKRMRNLGICVNLFANHLYYFGDTHLDVTLGPDRANRMDACRDAAEIFGGDFAIHSDAPVTPMAPLFTAWCAVNRLTQAGRRLGDSQQVSVANALHCITLGAAYVLKLDDELGSIETGKRADFCILEDDPTGVDPKDLKDIAVCGTVLGGEHFARM